MLNPDETAKLARLFADSADSAQAAAEHKWVQCDIVSHEHSADLVFEERPPEQKMRAPAFVVGEPMDRSCLNGIGEQSIRQPPRRVHRYGKGRVIGWRTALTQSGELFCGKPIQSPPLVSNFSRWASQGAEGVIPLARGEQPTICYRRPGRELHFPGAALFLGVVEPGNYGSFIFRLLPQLLLAADQKIKFDCLVFGERTPWIASALSLLGLDQLPVFTVREVYGCLFDELLVMDEIDSEAFLDEFSLRRLRHFAEGCATRTGAEARSLPSKIYVSRALRTNNAFGYRTLLNEGELEDMARAAGFHVVHPETLSLAEQCTVFFAARALIGPSGSGMLNAAFAPEGAKLADLEGFHNTVRQHAKLYSSSGKVYGFAFGETFKTHPSVRVFDNWRLKAGFFEEALAAIT